MSFKLTIRSEKDMPLAAVDILSPDLQLINHLAIHPGTQETVNVYSENSIIRVHLPSGRSIILQHRDDLRYVLNRNSLESTSTSNSTQEENHKDIPAVRANHEIEAPGRLQRRSTNRPTGPQPEEFFRAKRTREPTDILAGRFTVSWKPPLEGRLSKDGREVAYHTKPRRAPFALRLFSSELDLSLLLPGSLCSIHLRVDEAKSSVDGKNVNYPSERCLVSIRLSTSSPAADSVVSFMASSNYFAARSMAKQARDLLQKMDRNPYAALAGSYLLLQLERPSLIRQRANEFCQRFPFIPDGHIIMAWQEIKEGSIGESTAKRLLRACQEGIPVFTEGLRLLSHGLRISGHSNKLRDLSERIGRVLWNSPFTGYYSSLDSRDESIVFDIGLIT